MNQYIDIYCERTASGFWDEPVNALTNAAFLIAAFFAFRLMQREKALVPETAALVFLTAAIGAGSFLFHTFATRAAMHADTFPVLLFQIVYIYTYARRVMVLDTARTAALLALFFVLTVACGMLPQNLLNGSIGYAPALLFLLGFGLYHRRAGKAGKNILLAAAGIFTLSLAFRTADMALCAALPLGTHFLWHMLNACVLYGAQRALVLNTGKT